MTTNSTGPTLHAVSPGPPSRPRLVLLQTLVTIGLSYHLLYSQGTLLAVEAQYLVILVLFVLVALLTVLPARVIEVKWFIEVLVLANTIITTAILWAGNPTSDLYLVYFLIILLASFTPSLKQMIGLSIILCVGYGAVLYVETLSTGKVLEAHFLRVPVLFILAIFYGVTTDTLRKEREQRVGLRDDLALLKRAEEALRESAEKFRDLVENTNDLFWEADQNGVYTYCSPNVVSILGYEQAELIGKTPFDFMPPEEAQRVGTLFGAIVAEQKPFSLLTHTIRRKDGNLGTMECSGRPFFDQQGQLVGYRGVDRDITERKHLEVQLRQAQKMEAIGQLAGGVAHDFNNLVTVITGYSELVLQSLNATAPERRNVEQIKRAGERAAGLTSQLLAFSRKQLLQPKVLNLNAVVTNIDSLLQRVIGEHIHLVTVLEPTLGRVKADPGQIEQVIMNLAVNARDAMPQGGKLTVETADVDLDQAFAAQHVPLQRGPYVMLAVSDTGCGMDVETQAHVFEPFFTTKQPGKGTGLGLSTVYGIVKQSGGYIWASSELGQGATFKIYLPRVQDTGETVEPSVATAERGSGIETVLLVEDEPAVRRLIADMLRPLGYRVLEARHGIEAQMIDREHKGPIHLLITDVVMPQISGRKVAELLTSSRPNLKVLFVSGYTDDAVVHHGLLEPGINFLQKPFAADTLARKVREVLDAPSRL